MGKKRLELGQDWRAVLIEPNGKRTFHNFVFRLIYFERCSAGSWRKPRRTRWLGRKLGVEPSECVPQCFWFDETGKTANLYEDTYFQLTRKPRLKHPPYEYPVVDSSCNPEKGR